MVPPLTKLSQSSSPSPEQGASEEVVRALVFLFVRVEVEFRDFCTFSCSWRRSSHTTIHEMKRNRTRKQNDRALTYINSESSEQKGKLSGSEVNN